MGTNRHYGDRTLDAEIDRALARKSPPVTLPAEASGPQPIEWTTSDRAPVWVWVQWRERPAERVPGFVKGHNDRIVIVEISGEGGGWEVVVWRNAVAHRRVSPAAAPGGRSPQPRSATSPPR